MVSESKPGGANPEGVTRGRLYLLRSYDHYEVNEPTSQSDEKPSTPQPRTTSKLNYGPAELLSIWQVARAATAAPMYFKEISFTRIRRPTLHFMDGGFVANNPTKIGIQEVESLYGNTNLGAIVNIGTSPRPRPRKGLPAVIRAFLEANWDSDLELGPRPYYWRFNDENGIEVTCDEWKPNGRFTKDPGHKTTEKITSAFRRWIVDPENQKNMRSCARELVRRRRRRIKDRNRWEVYATCTVSQCGAPGCHEITFHGGEDLAAHLSMVHGFDSTEAQVVADGWTKRWRYQTGG